jgi:hypothetical protein
MIIINCSCGNRFLWNNDSLCCKCGNKIPKEFSSMFTDIDFSLLEISNLATKRSGENLCKPFTITAE